MACKIGGSTINIIEDLQENAEEYDFFQAVKLLNRYQEQKKSVEPTTRTRRRRVATKAAKLKIRPDLSLDYVDSDINDVIVDDEGNIELTTNFMGLYGISSPLPAYYTEELLDDQWDADEAPREFLDIIHQHLYPMLYSAWQKYRFAHQTVEQHQERYWDVLYSFIGLADPEFRQCNKYSQQLLPYLGLISQRQKSLVGFSTILKDVLNTDDVRVIPCVERTVNIPENQYSIVGSAQNCLGVDCTIGSTIQDRMGKAVIEISSVTGEHLQKCLNDEEYIDFIRSLCDFYLSQPLDIEIVLVLNPNEVSGVSLGQSNWSGLGVDSWMQSAQYQNDETQRVTIYK
ncbi:type VI secretion system baseplate subunit TssG [Marinicellulosiphila megalodicopiae]|uniref:type VI secretion system baseplate subunit TssG n=1 Tax=Marinicellulosiphila megalodicopiae TaxID=2724896 RepID=UPI003BB21922